MCGSQPNLQRQVIKEMLLDWSKRYPGRIESMFRSMQNVVPSHLMDTTLYGFTQIQTTGVASADGDIVFDKEEFSLPQVINW